MMTIVDLGFSGRRRVIGTAVLEGPSGVALVDPGPTSCLPALENGLRELGHRLEDVRTLLITHIHLDHAGATGTLLHRLPRARAYVHERGAPHLVDPSRLLASAGRLYGSDMDRLWGECRPAPSDRVNPLAGGERLEIAGRTFEVKYTPGHASHHVSYFDTTSGIAYVGDTAGIRVAGDYIKAPTPPPDIDLESWEQSLRAIEAWTPAALVLTHFGRIEGVADHLRRFRSVLDRQARLVRETLAVEGSDEERIRRFSDAMRADARQVLSEEDAAAAEAAAAFDQLWLGLARYWRKRSVPAD
jgi:glyoxylase-like metal-dependent hydrolase (beta-lactamase superfamily II)